MARTVTAVIIASLWIACSTYGEEAPAPPVDVPDAATDAASETSTVIDATIDAPADAPLGTFCGTIVMSSFCADFDTLLVPPYGWDGTIVSAGTQLSLDPQRFKSPPNALHATSSGDKNAHVAREFSVSKRISVELDVFVALPLPTTAAALGALRLTSIANGTRSVLLFAQNTGHYFQEGTSEFSLKEGGSEAKWRHVALTVDVDGAPRANGSLDGKQLWINEPLTPEWQAPAKIVVEVGAPGPFSITGEADVWIDNVVVRVDQP